MSEWTKTAPTKPGHYFGRSQSGATRAFEVVLHEGQLLVIGTLSTPDELTAAGVTWSHIPTAAALAKAREALREAASALHLSGSHGSEADCRKALAALGEPEESPDAD